MGIEFASEAVWGRRRSEARSFLGANDDAKTRPPTSTTPPASARKSLNSARRTVFLLLGAHYPVLPPSRPTRFHTAPHRSCRSSQDACVWNGSSPRIDSTCTLPHQPLRYLVPANPSSIQHHHTRRYHHIYSHTTSLLQTPEE